MFDHDVLVLDERGPGVLLAGSSMVTSMSNYMHRSKDTEALERQVRRWTRSMSQARSDFADATPPAGQHKLGEFLRPGATMPQPPPPQSGTTPTSAVPSAIPTAAQTAVLSEMQLPRRASRHILDWQNFSDRCSHSHESPPQRSTKQKNS